MMKSKLKNAKGVSLVALSIIVIVLVILTDIVIYNVKNSLRLEKLKNMQSDITNLSDKISSYYAKNGKIPVKLKYTNVSNINVISSAVDTGDFYVIDLKSLDNLTLNYGKDYENITSDMTQNQINSLVDLYIINEASHNIFYVEGIKVDDDIFYTNYGVEDVDQKAVDLRYVENIKIPEGYTYIEGTKDTGIKIRDNENGSEYIWVVQTEKIETVPADVTVDDEWEFIDSVNSYQGYYKSTSDNTVIYLGDKWTGIYDKSATYKDKNNNTVNVPSGFKICLTPEKDTVDVGLVAKDINDNEWVWIEVPKSIYKTAKSNTDYDGIKSDLINYAKTYRNGSASQSYSWTDEWYDGEGNTADTSTNLNDTTGCGLTSAEYTTTYQKMLSSVYTNGGFWIGRYEAGIEGSITDTSLGRIESSSRIDSSSPKAISKPNAIPYNWIYCSEAQSLARDMSTDSTKTSSLMFGIQWDLVCKFLEVKSDLDVANINSDSGNWGNYANVSIEITSKNAKQLPSEDTTWSQIQGEKASNNPIRLSTGASRSTCKMNLYDFAGNEWEWTLEKTTISGYPCSPRGGCSSTNSYEYPASCRNGYGNVTSHSKAGVSFRVALY